MSVLVKVLVHERTHTQRSNTHVHTHALCSLGHFLFSLWNQISSLPPCRMSWIMSRPFWKKPRRKVLNLLRMQLVSSLNYRTHRYAGGARDGVGICAGFGNIELLAD